MNKFVFIGIFMPQKFATMHINNSEHGFVLFLRKSITKRMEVMACTLICIIYVLYGDWLINIELI